MHIVVCGTHESRLLIPDYSITVSGALVGEIKSIKGSMVEPSATP